MAGGEVHDDRLFPKHIYDVELQALLLVLRAWQRSHEPTHL